MATSVSNRMERIDLRTTHSQKVLLQRAAAHAGMSVSAFLLAAAQERAQEVLAGEENLTLTAEDWKAFFKGLDRANRPRPKLAAAVKRYHTKREKV